MTNSEIKQLLNRVIFGTSTPAGKLFDVILIAMILLSVVVLMLESLKPLSANYQIYFRIAEWVFTIVFTLEYMTRFYCSPKPFRYAGSFYGLIDLLSVMPSYLSLFFPGANYLLIVRLLRVLRVFRVLKLVRYISDANILIRSMIASRRKILVFFFLVVVLSVIFGSLMYIVEGPQNGFTSIPKSVYWTIVTITTVGYGDITPQTSLGQLIAALAMLTGYSIFAVPTGILTAELSHEMQRERMQNRCNSCGYMSADTNAVYCARCGVELHAGG
jgi:voltage-gated potassium channel